MKKLFLILVAGTFCLSSCQKDEVKEQTEDAVVTEELPLEYFRADINGFKFEAKDTAFIAGTAYPSRNTGVINFDFSAWEKTGEENYYGFMFKVCFYDGPGVYHTGTEETVSWAMYWEGYDLWENHYSYGNEPGTVTITSATDEFVEGTFEFEAYNPELESMVDAVGEFGLKLESQEQYNK